MRRLRAGAGAGFTLVETMFALVLVALLASLALPWTAAGRGNAAVTMEAHRIASLLRADRNTALRLRRAVTTAVDARSRTVSSGASPASIGTGAAIAIRLLPPGLAGVTFLADGRASGAELVLASDRASAAVEVNAYTGAVTVRPR